MHCHRHDAAQLTSLTDRDFNPPRAITRLKFARTVLPTARRMAVFTESNMTLREPVRALHPNARPILQWDRAEARNRIFLARLSRRLFGSTFR